MDRRNRRPIDEICDNLIELRAKAYNEHYGLLAYLIGEAIEEGEKIRAVVSEFDKPTDLA